MTLKTLAAAALALLLAISISGPALACACDDGPADNLCEVGQMFDPQTARCVAAPVS